MKMLEFLNLAQTAPIFMTVGVVLFLIGFFLGGNAKKDNAAGVFSMILKTVGIICALIAVAYWVTTSLTDWAEYSEKML